MSGRIPLVIVRRTLSSRSPSMAPSVRALVRQGHTKTCAAALSTTLPEGHRHGGDGARSAKGWEALAVGLALAVGASVVGQDSSPAKNCGIVGVVSARDTGGEVDAREFLLEVRSATALGTVTDWL